MFWKKVQECVILIGRIINKMFYSVITEAKIFLKLKSIIVILLVYILFLSYFLKESVLIYKSTPDGTFDSIYYISQLLLVTCIFGSCIISIIAGIVGSMDYSWITWNLSILKTSRSKIIFTKLVFLSLICFIISIISYILGLVFTIFMSDHGLQLGDILNSIYQLFLTIYICIFWAVLSFTISYLCKNILTGSIACILFIIFEPVLYKHINSNIKMFLPIWNQRSILYEFFKSLNNGGILIIPYDNYNNIILSLTIFNTIIIILLILLLWGAKKKSFE